MEISHTQLTHLKVHASKRSRSSLRIAKEQKCKEKDKKDQSQLLRMEQSPLCKGIIREQKEDEETRTHENSPRKKVNLGQKSFKTLVTQKKLQVKTILEILKEEERQEYFWSSEVSRPAQRNENYNKDLISGPVIFPSQFVESTGQSSNELLTRTIEIMSNKNQKITIPIHEGLYKSNTSHKSDIDEKNIPNLCDFQLKNQYSDSIQFIRQYKSGYTPIEMQKKNNQEVYELNKEQSPVKGTNKDKTRNHFIRKQQSTLTLPRTCGVSYIKPSESLLTQKQPFEPLPPLIFQGSTSCAIGVNQENQVQIDFQKRELIDQFSASLETSWLPFIISDEDQMRDLLLAKKTKKARVGFVEGIENLWPLYVEGVFILILVSPKKLLTEPQVWEAFENKQTFFKIGILSKKSTSGKKSFLKSIKAEQNCNVSVKSLESNENQAKQSTGQFNIVKTNLKEGNLVEEIREISSEERKVSSTFEMLEKELKDNRTVITMSLRLEMYVEEKDWKENYNRESKDLLNEIIISLKDKLEKKSIRVIGERLGYSRESKLSNFQKKFDFLRIGKCINTENGRLTGSNQATSTLCTNLSVLHKNTANLSLSNSCKQILISNSEASSPRDFIQPFTSEQAWKKSLKFPLYYISTRDSFAFDLIQKHTLLQRQNGQKYTRIDYYFYPDNIPTNYGSEYRKLFPNLDVGVTAYHGFFTQEEMLKFEGHTFELEQKAFKNKFLQMTVQPSIVSTKIKRTKFFFGYRYMWTRCQLSQPCSYVGAGVRKDVAKEPEWTKQISEAMTKEKIVEKDFINSIAINVYHDGKEGLAQHFDDAVRFKQPIYTLRLFSDARLSFGSQFYGFCNGAFIIPLPRGCILVMEENSYAANGVKHCVRPCDMTGKSAAIILRQMHSQVVSEASRYDELIDFPAWLSCISEDQKAISFAQQKRMEAEQIMKVKDS